MSPSLIEYLKPTAMVALPHLGAAAGALVARSVTSAWTQSLNKAPWSPPGWVFGPMWTCLYTGMGYASWLVFKEAGLRSRPMYLYGAQLALNWAWSPLFFGKPHRVGLAALDILALTGLVAACVKEFRPVSLTAYRLMLPYLTWLCLASTLNCYIWLFNDSKTLRGSD